MKKYLTDANSALGYASLQQENLTGVAHLYFLKNSHDQLTHFLLSNLLNALQPQAFELEAIYSSFDTSLLTGLILRDQSIAFVSGKIPPDNAIVLDFLEAYRPHNQKSILRLKEDMNEQYDKLYQHFHRALIIHDDWEKIYINNMDFEKADALKEKVITQFFHAPPKDKEGLIVRRFFGASTTGLYFDFIQELTAGLKRYLIKGRPGTGKSTLMKAVAAHTKALGYNTEVYHCGFDPNSLDMVLVPELGICIFDATAPHEYFPTESTDEVIDTYQAFVNPGTDQLFEQALKSISTRYKQEIKQGIACLKKAHDLRQKINTLYDQALDMDQALFIFSDAMML